MERTIPALVMTFPLLLAACVQDGPAGPDPAFGRAAATAYSVTGSGHVDVMTGFGFRQTVAARLDGDGAASGTVVVHITDASAFGLAGTVTLSQEVRCMVVAGNTAWIGTRIVHSTNPAFGAPGDAGVAWVVDVGGPGEDITYGGPSVFWDTGDAICSGNPPSLPATVATGNFQVRAGVQW